MEADDTMKALAKLERGPGLTLTRVKKPEVGHNDVLIRIRKTAICGTDVHIWKWDDWAQKTIPVPMHVGHEYVGVVEEVGSAVSRVRPDVVFTSTLFVQPPFSNCTSSRRTSTSACAAFANHPSQGR